MDDFVIPMHLLLSGQTAHIDQLLGDPDAVHRLEEMGLRTGASVEMLQPGSPCIIKLAGHKLCFRDAEACSVLVRPEVPL